MTAIAVTWVCAIDSKATERAGVLVDFIVYNNTMFGVVIEDKRFVIAEISELRFEDWRD